MSEKQSYSDIFSAGDESQPSFETRSAGKGPEVNGQSDKQQNTNGTGHSEPERSRHEAIIPGYTGERIRERKILTLRDLLYIFFKHLQSITIITAVCFFTSALYSFSVTPLYKADTKLMIRLGREKMPNLTEQSNNVSFLYQERNQNVNNELEIFKGDELSHMVYQDLKGHFDREEQTRSGLRIFLSSLKAHLTSSKLTREDKIVLSLKESLKVEFLAETDILKLSFSDPDPEFAALAANAYANAFIKLRTKIYEIKKSHIFYIDQISLYQKKADALLEEEKIFAGKWNISEIDKQQELLLLNREKIEVELLNAQQDYDRNRALLRGIKEMYDSPGDWIETPKMSENEMVDRQAYLQDIDRQYFTLKLERSRLIGQFTEKSREIQQLDSTIAQLRKQKYLSLINILELNRSTIEPVIHRLTPELEKKNRRIEELIQAHFTLQQMKLKKDVAIEALLNYTKKAEDLRIYDDLDKSKITSLTTINTAIAPLKSYFPQKGLILLTATFFGIFLSFGLSAVKEFFTHVFRDGQDVESILKVPLLMSIGHQERL
ncbi:MAG: hypothetical protein KJ990_02875 [Proteobacteria bacterium]|nr:hypothetical protein [Pseudomonadota bacterium]MBU1648134.1 hypothetical protein [Pseudomonadota bacterium]